VGGEERGGRGCSGWELVGRWIGDVMVAVVVVVAIAGAVIVIIITIVITIISISNTTIIITTITRITNTRIKRGTTRRRSVVEQIGAARSIHCRVQICVRIVIRTRVIMTVVTTITHIATTTITHIATIITHLTPEIPAAHRIHGVGIQSQVLYHAEPRRRRQSPRVELASCVPSDDSPSLREKQQCGRRRRSCSGG